MIDPVSRMQITNNTLANREDPEGRSESNKDGKISVKLQRGRTYCKCVS